MAESDTTTPSAGEARLIPQGSHAGAPPISIKRPATLIGSRKDVVRLHLDSSTVSNVHCVIVLSDWGCYIHDLGSRTHTWVNGQQVTDADLADGDTVQIGRFQFVYQAPRQTGSRQGAPQVELDVSTLTDPLPITKRVIQIGRRRGSDLEFDEDKVSNVHAILFERNGHHYVRDIGSRTGTWLDGKPIHQERVADGSKIRIGSATITLNEVAPAFDDLPAAAVPPAAVVAPRIDKPAESFDIGAIPLELDEPETDATEVEVESHDEPAAEVDLGLDLADESAGDAEALSDDAIAAALAAPEAEPQPESAAIDLSADVDNEIELAPDAEAPTDESDEDALGALRRGWRGASRTDESDESDEADEAEAEVAPQDEVAAPVEPAIDLAPAAEPVDEVEPEPAAEIAPEVESEIDVVSDVASEAPIAVEPEPQVGPEAPDDESAVIAEAAPIPPVVTTEADAQTGPDEPADAVIEQAVAPEAPVVEDAVAPETIDEPAITEPSRDATDEAVVASPAAEIEPIDLPAPPLPEPIVVPVDDVTDDDGAIDLADAPAMPVAGAIAEPELPLEADAAGLDEVEPAVVERDVDFEAIELGESESVADVVAEIGAPDAVADEAEDELDAVAETPTDETIISEEAAEAAVAEPEPVVIDESSDETGDESVPEPEATHEEIAEAVIEEPVIESAAETESIVSSEPAADDSDADDPLGELELLDEPKGESDPETTDTTPAPVADLEGIDFSELDLNDESDDAFEDTAADTAFAVSELDPFDLEENETAEPLMNLADSIVGETHDGVEVMEETSPTPASALQEFVDADDDEPVDDSPDVIDDTDIHDASDTLVIDAEADTDDRDPDTKDVLGGLIAPPPAGDLRDLIPQHGPMLGGAFAPQPQGFMIGGSPLVGDQSQSPGKPAAKAPRPGKPASDASDADARRPHRVGFGQQQTAKQGSPFAADGNRTIADVLIGRRAAASVDVFANPSPTPEDLLLDEKEGDHPRDPAAANGEPLPVQPVDENDELLKTAERFRPRGAISAMSSFPQVDIPPVYKPEDDPEYLAKLRKRRLRTVLLCTLALVPLIGGIVLGVFKYFPVETKIVATITYDGLANASEHRKQEFKTTHTHMLTEEYTRGLALNELGPDWDNKKGFLSSTDAIKAALLPTPSERWPDAHRDQMHLIMMSRDKENDLARLRALATGMVKADEQQARRAQRLREEAASSQKEVETLREELERIDKKLDVNRALGENRPDDARLAEVEARRRAADQDVTAAIKVRQEIEAAIERLRTESVEALAPLPSIELEAEDEALAKLTAQVEEIRKQSAARTDELAAQTDAARKNLDAAVSKLEADLAAAKQDEINGKLGDYVAGAKTLSTEMKNLTEDLLRRQELQYTRWQELKQKLSDRFEQRNSETLAGDLQLKQMKDELSMLERQQNAAVAEGMTEEADRVSALMKLLKVKIEEKEYQHKNDPVQQEVIASLESIIQQTARSIAEDRKDINERLAAAREDFLRKAPRVDQLPEDQKEVAASIEKQFAAVAEARKAYSAAADEAEADQAKMESANREALAKLQAEIHGRKIELAAAAKEKQAIVAEQNRKKRLEEKQLELAAARRAQEAKESALAVVMAEKEKMEEHRRKLLETERETAELVSLKSEKEQRSKHLNVWLRSKEAELAGIIIPSSKVDVQSFDQDDRRPLYAGVGAGVVFLLMLVPIVHNLRLLSRDSHAPKPTSSTAARNGFDPILNQDTEAPVEEEPAEPVATR